MLKLLLGLVSVTALTVSISLWSELSFSRTSLSEVDSLSCDWLCYLLAFMASDATTIFGGGRAWKVSAATSSGGQRS